jgi:hypothetical protein
MPKLHELLAVEGKLKGQADKTRTDLKKTLETKRHLFSEKIVTFAPLAEGEHEVTEEQLDLTTTVPQELRWLAGIIAPALDASYQVAVGNTVAKADVEVNGTKLLKDVPATALLELEKRVTELHQFVNAIPVLDPAKGFREDKARGADVFVAREDAKKRTAKKQRPMVLYEATKEHPAQVQVVSEDVPVGTVTTREWSGLITSAVKGTMIERVELLGRAVKQARSRANEVVVDVAANKIGQTVLDYVFQG